MTSGKAGGLKDSEPLKAVEVLAAFRRLVATWYTQPLGFGRLAGDLSTLFWTHHQAAFRMRS
jgi:hypothetical protein